MRFREERQIFDMVLGPLGIEYEIKMGKTHPKLLFKYLGREITYMFAGTSSDYRSLQNMKSTLKKVMNKVKEDTQ